jgi:multiple sugar transport system permease protein
MRLWRSAPLFGVWMLNSLLVAILTVGFHLVMDCCAGYVLAKRRFRGRTTVFVFVIAAMMIPRQVTLIPLFLNMSRWGLADTYWGLLLPGFGDVIGVFLFRQYLLSLPDGLLEAARMDGASQAAILRHVVFPLSKPVLAVLAVLSFQHYWSDFFWPLVIMHEPQRFTLQVGLAYLAQSEFGPDYPLLAAGACAAALPILLVFLAFRSVFFEGARAGALK